MIRINYVFYMSLVVKIIYLTLSVHVREGYSILFFNQSIIHPFARLFIHPFIHSWIQPFIHSFIDSFTHSLCQQRISKIVDFYCLERSSWLDDDLNPCNLTLFYFEKTRENANFNEVRYTAILIQILLLAFCIPVLNFFCLVLGSFCCWRCASFINCKYAWSKKTCAQSVCVAYMSESPNVLVPTFVSYQDKVNTLKPENAMKSQKVVKALWLSIKLVKQL